MEWDKQWQQPRLSLLLKEVLSQVVLLPWAESRLQRMVEAP
jgi:hypothetical protein